MGMNRLVELFPNDPQVSILKGLFEHLMEEVEDAQRIWTQQSDAARKVIKEIQEHSSDRLEEKEEFEYQTIKELHDVKESESTKYTLFALWAYPLRIAFQFGCSNLMDV